MQSGDKRSLTSIKTTTVENNVTILIKRLLLPHTYFGSCQRNWIPYVLFLQNRTANIHPKRTIQGEG